MEVLMKKISIILILFALVLTACESSNANADVQPTKRILGATSPAGTEGPIVVIKDESSTAKTPEEQALLDSGAVILIHRSGGFAGVNEQWSFYADGKIVKDSGDQSKADETISVDAVLITSLLEALKTACFFDMKASSGIGGMSNCKDCFTYKLAATSDGKINSITLE